MFVMPTNVNSPLLFLSEWKIENRAESRFPSTDTLRFGGCKTEYPPMGIRHRGPGHG